MASRGRAPLVRKSPELNACAATVNAIDQRYRISRAHMSMLVEAIENEVHQPDAAEAMISAIADRYRMKKAHVSMLVEAFRGLVTILQSEEHRVDHD